MAYADEPISYPTIGTQTVGVAVGPFFPIRVAADQSSKLFGTAAMPSWSMTITDPIGSNLYRGQVSFGAELLTFGTSEPLAGYGVGITPKLQYTFVKPVEFDNFSKAVAEVGCYWVLLNHAPEVPTCAPTAGPLIVSGLRHRILASVHRESPRRAAGAGRRLVDQDEVRDRQRQRRADASARHQLRRFGTGQVEASCRWRQ